MEYLCFRSTITGGASSSQMIYPLLISTLSSSISARSIERNCAKKTIPIISVTTA